MTSKKQVPQQKFLEKNKRQANAYFKYSGLGIQMALIITFCALGAVQIDQYLNTKPVFTVIGSLAGVALSLYVFIKQIIVENNQDGE